MPDEDEITIEIADESGYPSVDKLLALANSHYRVIVEMAYEAPHNKHPFPDPSRETKQALIGELQPILPDHTVRESSFIEAPTWKDPGFGKLGRVHRYRSRLIITRLATPAQIEEALPRLVAAVKHFRQLANDLMTRQANQLGLDPTFFAEPHAWAGRFDQRGKLDEEWQRFFHGYECGFGNVKTKQSVEVRLGFQLEDGTMEFGVLDSGFFCRFLRSTQEYADLHDLLRDNSDSAARAMKRMVEGGHLRKIQRTAEDRFGLVAVD